MFQSRFKRSVLLLPVVLACAFFPVGLRAQQSDSQIDPQAFKALLQRVQELEARVHELEAGQQGTQSATAATATTPSGTEQPSVAQNSASQNVAPTSVVDSTLAQSSMPGM